MTPLLPTIGQDFGEVGQKSSDAALSNLLLKLPKKKLHPDPDISSAIFVFIPPSSERFIELSIGLSAPSLSSSSLPASGGKQLLQTQQTSTRPPNRL